MRWSAIRFALVVALLMSAAHRAHAQNSTVANMTPAATLIGPELFYCVQGGQDRKCTGTQITALLTAGATGYLYANGSGAATFSTTIPGTAIASGSLPGTAIASGSLPGTALLAGTITGTAIAANTIANSNLASMASDTIKCNPNGSTHAPVDCTGAQAAAIIGAQASLRFANPTNFYIATTGSDSNACTSSGAPCLTLQHAVDVAMVSYDLQGSNAVINVAAGTYPAGALIAGTAVGAANGGGNPAAIEILGASSGSTTIYTYGSGGPGTHTGGQCSAQPYPLLITSATVFIGSITLESACAGAATLYAETFSYVYVVNSDVQLWSEYSGLNSVFEAYDHSSFNGDYPFAFYGNANIGISISSQSAVYLNSTGAYTVSGNYTQWLDAFDGSFFNWGEGSWTGSVTGSRYALEINAFVDSEQNTSPLPGSTPGFIDMGSQYYADTTTTATVVSSSGATASLSSGSADHAGEILVGGNGSNSSGTVVIETLSRNYGSAGDGGFCVAGPGNDSTSWNARASAFPAYNSGTGYLTVKWDNNGVALGSGDNYAIPYYCE